MLTRISQSSGSLVMLCKPLSSPVYNLLLLEVTRVTTPALMPLIRCIISVHQKGFWCYHLAQVQNLFTQEITFFLLVFTSSGSMQIFQLQVLESVFSQPFSLLKLYV